MDPYWRNRQVRNENYVRAKAYTRQFQNWLWKTAHQRGHEIIAHVRGNIEKKELNKGKRRNKKQYKMQTIQMKTLVDKIASDGKPLQDMTGILYLRDAVRLRSEVTESYKLEGENDPEHNHFIKLLNNLAGTLVYKIIPSMLYDHELGESPSDAQPGNRKSKRAKKRAIPTRQQLSTTIEEEIDDDGDESAEKTDDSSEQSSLPLSTGTNSTANEHDKSQEAPDIEPLTEEEFRRMLEFRVLVFLFEFNQLRHCVKEVWSKYRAKDLSLVTASLISDLAQGHLQQMVNAVVEEIEEHIVARRETRSQVQDGKSSHVDQSLATKRLSRLVKRIYYKTTKAKVTTMDAVTLSPAEHRSLFCMDAIKHFDGYQDLVLVDPQKKTTMDVAAYSEEKYPYMPFLLFFKRLRQGKFRTPILDKFSECMVKSKTGIEPELPFCFQIVLDIQEITQSSQEEICEDAIQQSIRLNNSMRDHIEYEDEVWDTNRPDYHTVGETKFSSIFLGPSQVILDWIEQALDEGGDGKPRKQQVNQVDAPVSSANPNTKLTNKVFLSGHPTCAGLAIYCFRSDFKFTSMAKVQWFMVALAHLYNACRQVGGLDLSWPDLDFIIDTHGTQRIFLGDPPTMPDAFYSRLLLSTSASSRMFASNFRSGKFIRTDRKYLKEKRGLRLNTPLEEHLHACYRNRKGRLDELWMCQHNMYAYLWGLERKEEKRQKPEENSGSSTEFQKLCRLFELFGDIIAPRDLSESSKPGKSKKSKKGEKPRVPRPGFSEEYIHARLLSRASKEFGDEDLHSNFDYLEFFRRAFIVVTEIRDSILYDQIRELNKQLTKHQTVNNFNMLADFFSSFRVKFTSNKDAKGHEVSKEVLPIERLKTISTLMEVMIEDWGSVQLDDAKKVAARDWAGLKRKEMDEAPVDAATEEAFLADYEDCIERMKNSLDIGGGSHQQESGQQVENMASNEQEGGQQAESTENNEPEQEPGPRRSRNFLGKRKRSPGNMGDEEYRSQETYVPTSK